MSKDVDLKTVHEHIDGKKTISFSRSFLEEIKANLNALILFERQISEQTSYSYNTFLDWYT